MDRPLPPSVLQCQAAWKRENVVRFCNTNGDNRSRGSTYLAIGIALGISLGSGFGVAFGAAMGNVALGVALGPGIGLALGISLAVAKSHTTGTSDK